MPVLDPAGGRLTLRRAVYGRQFQITFYRPRIEGLFSRIERWTARRTGISHWRTISRDNVTTLYGYDPGSRSRIPPILPRSFPGRSAGRWDDKGNVAVYSYVSGRQQRDRPRPRRTRRTGPRPPAPRRSTWRPSGTATSSPISPDWTAEQEAALPADWMFTRGARLRRPQQCAADAAPRQPWPLRPDPFSTYRAGFEVRTYRRIQRLLFFNNFPHEPTAGPDCLVRSLDLVYSDQQTPPDPAQPDLHVPGLGDPDRLPAERPAAWSPGRCRHWSSPTASRRSSRRS